MVNLSSIFKNLQCVFCPHVLPKVKKAETAVSSCLATKIWHHKIASKKVRKAKLGHRMQICMRWANMLCEPLWPRTVLVNSSQSLYSASSYNTQFAVLVYRKQFCMQWKLTAHSFARHMQIICMQWANILCVLLTNHCLLSTSKYFGKGWQLA